MITLSHGQPEGLQTPSSIHYTSSFFPLTRAKHVSFHCREIFFLWVSVVMLCVRAPGLRERERERERERMTRQERQNKWKNNWAQTPIISWFPWRHRWVINTPDINTRQHKNTILHCDANKRAQPYAKLTNNGTPVPFLWTCSCCVLRWITWVLLQ